MTARTAFIVYGWLLALTAFELAVVMVGGPKTLGAVLLAAATVGKGLLIFLYFMHVRYDSPLVWILPGVPVFLALFFIVAIFPDIVYKLVLKM